MSSFKDTRRVLALAEKRVNKRIGASQSLGKVEQCLMDVQGESMERLELELKIQNGDGSNSTIINLTASAGPKRNTSNK